MKTQKKKKNGTVQTESPWQRKQNQESIGMFWIFFSLSFQQHLVRCVIEYV